jgi:hypothetical protein
MNHPRARGLVWEKRTVSQIISIEGIELRGQESNEIARSSPQVFIGFLEAELNSDQIDSRGAPHRVIGECVLLKHSLVVRMVNRSSF